ncbi:MAG: type II secretion system protein [Candidatus Saccharimonadales bacterium]
MLNKIKKNKSDGFTIIEVLIVLAIAGLILLIVFLAVPALQRNAHNTAAKNDVAGLLGAMSEYVNNNSGSLPAAQAAGSGASYVIGSGAGISTATAKLGYYTGADVSIVTTVPATAPTSGVVIVEKATCSGNSATATGASPRGYAAWYVIEGGGTQCSSS